MSNSLPVEYSTRFSNLQPLYVDSHPDALSRLFHSHVCVIGLGGVGSWVVESLARSGVGTLTLVDADDVCVSNTNRQILALSSTVGGFKADVLKARVMDINPCANVHVLHDFVREENANEIIGKNRFTYIVDCVDSAQDKAAILAACVRSHTAVITCGGVGGLYDPSLITVSDLTTAEGDNLSSSVRKLLRTSYGFPKGLTPNSKSHKLKKWGILCVHTLPTGFSRSLAQTDSGDACAVSSGLRRCDGGGLGTASHVTGVVGLLMAGQVVNQIATDQCAPPKVRISLSPKQASPAVCSLPMAAEEDACGCGSEPAKSDPQTAESLRLWDVLRGAGVLTTPLPALFDAHCHLQLSPLKGRAEELLAALKDAGLLCGVSVCSTSPADWSEVDRI
eukprot:gene38927-47351_t